MEKIVIIPVVNTVSMAPVIDLMEAVFLDVLMDSLGIHAIKVYVFSINIKQC